MAFLQAGVQTAELYEYADQQGITLPGGACVSVGIAGGYLQVGPKLSGPFHNSNRLFFKGGGHRFAKTNTCSRFNCFSNLAGSLTFMDLPSTVS
jgi:hypothetical protein